jgi:hypothetical protein
MFNFLKSKKKKDSKKTNNNDNNEQIDSSYDIDELFKEDPAEKAKIEAWWLQKGVEEVVEEDYEPEPEPETPEDEELMDDDDDLIYSLKEEDDDDDDTDLVIKEAMEAIGESTSEELLKIGEELLVNIKSRIPIEEEVTTE